MDIQDNILAIQNGFYPKTARSYNSKLSDKMKENGLLVEKVGSNVIQISVNGSYHASAITEITASDVPVVPSKTVMIFL